MKTVPSRPETSALGIRERIRVLARIGLACSLAAILGLSAPLAAQTPNIITLRFVGATAGGPLSKAALTVQVSAPLADGSTRYYPPVVYTTDNKGQVYISLPFAFPVIENPFSISLSLADPTGKVLWARSLIGITPDLALSLAALMVGIQNPMLTIGV